MHRLARPEGEGIGVYFDPEAARELLAEARYPHGFEMSIYYRDVTRGYLPTPGDVAADIQTQLRENLGINAEIVQMESAEFIQACSTAGTCDGIHLLGWTGDYPHVTNFLDFHFAAGNAQFGEPHPEIYEPLEEASQLTDAAAAAPLYAEANNAIKELAPMVPIAHAGAFFGASERGPGPSSSSSAASPCNSLRFLVLGEEMLTVMSASAVSPLPSEMV